MGSATKQQEDKASDQGYRFSEEACKAVAEYQILDTHNEKSFDGLCELALEIGRASCRERV